MISTPLSHHVVNSPDYEKIKEITTANLGLYMKREVDKAMEDGMSWADVIYNVADVEPSEPPQDNILNRETPTVTTYLERAESDSVGTITEAVEAMEVN